MIGTTEFKFYNILLLTRFIDLDNRVLTISNFRSGIFQFSHILILSKFQINQ